MQGTVARKRSRVKSRQRWEKDITYVFGKVIAVSGIAEDCHRCHRRSQDFSLAGATRPTPPSLASVLHTFEAVAGSWGSVSAPAVSRVMDGAPERNKIAKKYR